MTALTTAGPPPAAPSRAARVVHVPAAHAYVEHVSTPPVDGGTGLRPPGPGAPSRFTWEDDPGWVPRHAHEFDVLHVHFGFERYPLTRLRALLDELDAAGRPMVWTAHDLTNPHLVDQGPHEAQLALLAERAAAVLTLTPGAADEIARRWGRHPVVVAHPHLAPPSVLALGRPRPTATPVVGLPLGLLRPGTDPRVVPALLEAAAELPSVTVRVRLREEVLAAGFPRPDAALVEVLREAARRDRVDLRIGGRMSDAELWDELRGLSAFVLPYRWGSHSGWVEGCYDVGTPVVAPAVGHWGEQRPVHAYATGPDGPDRAALTAALQQALAAGPRPTSVLHERLVERTAGIREHRRVHALVAAGGRL